MTSIALGIAGSIAASAVPVLFRVPRKFGPFVAMVVVRESHRDELQITDHPVDQGAVISDHAFKRPREVTIEMGWSNSPELTHLVTGSFEQVTTTYQKLLAFQEGRVPFTILTGKDIYSNMLVKALMTETTKETENCLIVTAVCREIIRVKAVTSSAQDASVQADPENTQAPINNGLQQTQSAPSAPPPP